jgi:dienelactone hydrolase
MVIDAFRGLQAISQRNEVDLERVAIIGGSKGGIVAYQTLYKEYRDAAQIGALSFKLHIPLYPTCNWNDWTENYTTGKVIALLGGSDDFTPASLCIEHFKRMVSSGAAVQWSVYDGFHHGFDNGQGTKFIPSAATSRNCGVYVDLKDLKVKRRNDASVINDVGAHYKRCNERGAHTGGTPEQAQKVLRDVLRILKDRL